MVSLSVQPMEFFFQINFHPENASMVTLPEDVMLEGFPLITSAIKPIYCLKTEKKKSMLLSRLQVILDNGNEIFSVYNPSRQKTVHVAPQPSVNTKVNKDIFRTSTFPFLLIFCRCTTDI